jgi:tripartite-type tricarboxylate transporter receptor subunit TctC
MLPRRRAVLAGLALPLTARAQGRFPDQPVRIIIPFAAGGPADVVARAVSRVMGARLGQSVVIENRSGAGGVIGVEALARRRPDGHTLAFASTGALVLQPQIMPRLPYDPTRDLAPVSLVVSSPQALAVGPGVPVRDFAGFVAHARANPGKLSFGSAGTGGSTHLAGEQLRVLTGIDIVHVPYRGAAPALNDLLAGQIELVTLDLQALLPVLARPDAPVRALAILGSRRSPALPEVPSIVELGYAQGTADTWYGLVAPAETPPDRIATLHAALVAALADEPTRRVLADLGGEVVGSTPEELGRHMRREFDRWGELIRALGDRVR